MPGVAPVEVVNATELSAEVATVLAHRSGLVSFDAASRRVDTADWILPKAEILLWMVLACVLSFSSGCCSSATSLLTIVSASSPLPTPSDESVGVNVLEDIEAIAMLRKGSEASARRDQTDRSRRGHQSYRLLAQYLEGSFKTDF